MKLKNEPFLGCYLEICQKIAEYDGKIVRMEAVAYDPPDGMPAAKKEKPKGDGKKPVVNEKVDLEKKRNDLFLQRAYLKKAIISAINKVGDDRMERMLYAYYIQGKQIKEIAVTEQISYSYASDLLREGAERTVNNDS